MSDEVVRLSILPLSVLPFGTSRSRAEGEGVVSLEIGVASPESGTAGLVVSVDIRVRAVVLEDVVVQNTAGGASIRTG